MTTIEKETTNDILDENFIKCVKSGDLLQLQNVWNIYTQNQITLNNALIIASTRNYADIVEYLIKHNVDVKVENYKAFYSAINLNNIESVKMFLKSDNIDINYNDNYFFLKAIKTCQIEMIRLFLQYGADVNAKNGFALRYSCQNNNLDIVRLLILSGADIHIDDDAPLCIACTEGYLEIVKFLIKNGANIHAKNDRAFKFAFGGNYQEIVNYLILNGADKEVIKEYYSYTNIPPSNTAISNETLDAYRNLQNIPFTTNTASINYPDFIYRNNDTNTQTQQ